MQMISTWSLELCRACQGQGILGQADGYNIVCERCAGTALGWTERCAAEHKVGGGMSEGNLH